MRFLTIAIMVMLCGADSAAARSFCAPATGAPDGCYDLHGLMRLDDDMKPYLSAVEAENSYDVAPMPGGYLLPPNIAEMLTQENEVLGDFHVCPLMPREPGEMQPVCIDGAKNLVLRPDPIE